MSRPEKQLQDLVQRGYRFALSLTHDSVQAEDLLQDAWFAVLRRQGPWNRGYLFTTIRNRYIDQLRRRAVFDPLSLTESPEAQNDEVTFDDVDTASLNGNLDAALERLSGDERAVLYLFSVEEYTAQAIADLLNWPRGTVLSLVHRAKMKLRRTASGDAEVMKP